MSHTMVEITDTRLTLAVSAMTPGNVLWFETSKKAKEFVYDNALEPDSREVKKLMNSNPRHQPLSVFRRNKKT